jgi:hypothetical protein
MTDIVDEHELFVNYLVTFVIVGQTAEGKIEPHFFRTILLYCMRYKTCYACDFHPAFVPLEEISRP